MRACSVTSRPSASGRGIDGSAAIASAQARKTILAASGSQWMFHSVVGRRVAGHAERAAHQHVALEQARAVRLAQDREGEVRQRARA